MSDWDAGGEPVPVTVGGDDRETGRRPRAAGDDEALAELVAELERTLRELRTEVDDPRRPGRRGDRALPRPPTPRELLRFTETYTIPTVVALLEAAIRALELLAGAIRLLDGRDPRPAGRGDDGGILADASAAAGERAAETGREALAQVDDALAELQRAYEGEPTDPAASRLLADARALRDEIDDRLAAAERPAPDEGEARSAPDDRPTVDVDSELESLRQQAGRGGTDKTNGDDEA